jgi:hypothetical protein
LRFIFFLQETPTWPTPTFAPHKMCDEPKEIADGAIVNMNFGEEASIFDFKAESRRQDVLVFLRYYGEVVGGELVNGSGEIIEDELLSAGNYWFSGFHPGKI